MVAHEQWWEGQSNKIYMQNQNKRIHRTQPFSSKQQTAQDKHMYVFLAFCFCFCCLHNQVETNFVVIKEKVSKVKNLKYSRWVSVELNVTSHVTQGKGAAAWNSVRDKILTHPLAYGERPELVRQVFRFCFLVVPQFRNRHRRETCLT